MLSETESTQENKTFSLPSEEETKRDFFRQLKSVLSRSCVILLMLCILAQGAGFALSAFFHHWLKKGYDLPFSLDIANFLIGYASCLLADLLAIGLGLLLLKPNLRQDVFQKPQTNFKFTGISLLGVLGAGNIATVVYSIYSTLLTVLGIEFAVPEISGFSDPVATVLLILYMCILGPVCEEILFRGILLKKLEPFGKMSAILISSILFALFHMNLVQLPGPLLIGLILGYITVESKSIYPSILIHILNNTLRGLPGLFMTEEASVQNLLLTFYSLGIFAAGIVGIILFLLQYGRKFTNLGRWENLSRFSVGSKVLRLFMTVGSVLYLLFYCFFLVISSIFSA